MTIAALPTPPTRSDPSTFAARGDAFMNALPTFVTEANALAADVAAKQSTASTAASTATTQAAAASGSASAAATSASTASTQASSASSSASAASTSASAAASSASAAASSASAASTSAATATTKATEATASAAAASAIVLGVSTALPAMRPSLLLDFANAMAVDHRITFTRASTATRTNKNGLIELVASGVPRIDFDPITLACKGLLIEEARTNLLTYSEQFDNAAWTKTRCSVTANAATAPDGTATADKMVEDATASNSHFIAGPAVSTVSGTAYSLPIFIKSAERSWVFITGHSSSFGSGVFAFFNAATGAVGTTAGCTATCTPVGNGWFRASIAATATVTGSQVAYQLNLTTGDATYTHTGDGTSGLYIWGAQLEAGAFPTSYVPTVASQVTRAADVASMTGANFSNWYRADEGTFVVRGDVTFSGSTFPTLLDVDDGTGSNIVYVSSRSATTSGRMEVVIGGVPQVTQDSTTLTSGAAFTEAGAYKLNDYAIGVNGNAAVSDTTATVPTVDRLRIGCERGISGWVNGHISRIAYYPKRLSNAELQTLSA